MSSLPTDRPEFQPEAGPGHPSTPTCEPGRSPAEADSEPSGERGVLSSTTGDAGPGKALTEPPGGGSGTAPWYHRGNSVFRAEDPGADAASPDRGDLRDFLQEHAQDGYLATKAQTECGQQPVYGHDPEVHLRNDGSATFRGLSQCQDAKVCPVCAARQSLEEGDELQDVIDLWEEEFGGQVLMGTFTVSHHRGESLEDVRDLVATAYRKVKTGTPWLGAKTTTGMRDQVGYAGAVKVVEVTYGKNGWHPHVHVLWFLEEPLEQEELEELRSWLTDRWEKKVVGQGGETPHREKGVQVHAGQNAGHYLAKMGLGREASGLAHKSGRGGNLTPFEMLSHIWSRRDDPVGERGELEDRWEEYVRVMAGKQRIYVSGAAAELRRAVRAARQRELTEDPASGWGVRRDPVSDRCRRGIGHALQELELEPESETERVATIGKGLWKHVVRDVDGARGKLLEAAEQAGAAGVRRCLEELCEELPHRFEVRWYNVGRRAELYWNTEAGAAA